MSTTIHLVSHTHWDREWYLTFQQFRLRLVDLIDHAMEMLENDPDFTHFHLDAQTIVLEDYLEIRPGARDRLAGHIAAGRLGVGPWYQLNDQFLTSAESTVRSLLIGSRIARDFGNCLSLGYLPDQFGNISQMPQIFQGFGIDNAIVGRGYQIVEDRKLEFWWEAPDGSRVLASRLAYWYNNAQYIPTDAVEAAPYVFYLARTIAEKSATGHLLFLSGVDHLEPLPHIGRICREVDAVFAGKSSSPRIALGPMKNYTDAIRATSQNAELQVKHGELREDRGGSCLAGTLSSRMYLKQMNHAAESALEHYVERLSAFATACGAAYPFDQLRYAWKLLMHNHPHDSICGCSVDQVHREMIPRFDQVMQVTEELTERAIDGITGRDRRFGAPGEATNIVVINTLNWERTDPVQITLEFPLGPPKRGNPERDNTRTPKDFVLVDSERRQVPFAITSNQAAMRQVHNPHELNLDQWVQQIAIEFVAVDVPACGYTTYRLDWPERKPIQSAQTYTPARTDGCSYAFQDVGDVGDEYLYRRPAEDEVFTLSHTPITSVTANAVRHTTIREVEWLLPIAAEADGSRRSSERVSVPIRTEITRWAGVDREEITVHLTNTARDHRLRLLVGKEFASVPEEAQADGHFDVISRPLVHPLEPEGALPFHPQRLWTAITGIDGDGAMGERTLTVINKGLPEYEVTPRCVDNPLAGATIGVTLLRCVGQLSGRGDGPGLQTPDAQCLGSHTFEIATSLCWGDWQEGQVWKQARQFNFPLIAAQVSTVGLPDSQQFLTVEPSELVVSAIKRAEDRDSILVRFYNTVERELHGTVEWVGAIRQRLVNLDEEPQEDWQPWSCREMSVGPKKIITMEFERAPYEAPVGRNALPLGLTASLQESLPEVN